MNNEEIIIFLSQILYTLRYIKKKTLIGIIQRTGNI